MQFSVSHKTRFLEIYLILLDKIVYSSKVRSVTYLDFLHTRTIRDGTSDIKVSGKII